MSAPFHVKKLNDARLSDKASIVYDCLLANPEGLEYLEIKSLTGLSRECICGRIGDMRPMGLVWTQKFSKSPKKAFATSDRGDIQRTKKMFEIEEDRKDFAHLKRILKRYRDRGKINQYYLKMLYGFVVWLESKIQPSNI